MKIIIEEYGTLIVHYIIGTALVSIGVSMFVTIKPFVVAYITSLM